MSWSAWARPWRTTCRPRTRPKTPMNTELTDAATDGHQDPAPAGHDRRCRGSAGQRRRVHARDRAPRAACRDGASGLLRPAGAVGRGGGRVRRRTARQGARDGHEPRSRSPMRPATSSRSTRCGPARTSLITRVTTTAITRVTITAITRVTTTATTRATTTDLDRPGRHRHHRCDGGRKVDRCSAPGRAVRSVGPRSRGRLPPDDRVRSRRNAAGPGGGVALPTTAAIPTWRDGGRRLRAAGFTSIVQDVILGPELAAFVGCIRTRPRYVVSWLRVRPSWPNGTNVDRRPVTATGQRRNWTHRSETTRRGSVSGWTTRTSRRPSRSRRSCSACLRPRSFDRSAGRSRHAGMSRSRPRIFDRYGDLSRSAARALVYGTSAVIGPSTAQLPYN